MHHFEYRDGELHAEGVPLRRIADAEGTPAFVYSRATLERHFRVFDAAFEGHKHIICFSMKANSNLAVLRTLARLGAGCDIVSGGELYRALRVGVDPKKIVFSGVGKQAWEIERALETGILAFNVESHQELEAIEAIASRMGRRAPVSLRVNPDVDAQTHPYISTGLKKNKFGIAWERAREEYRFAASQKHIDVVGIDCHIGSQLTKVSPFRDAIARVISLAEGLAQDGIGLSYIDIGGGLGISYNAEEPPSPAEYGQAIGEAVRGFAGLDLTLVCEPGRVIVGNAGVLLTRVLYLKEGETKNFVIVDAGFNDLIRPAFYDSFHAMQPVAQAAPQSQSQSQSPSPSQSPSQSQSQSQSQSPSQSIEKYVADVVGPICETGDFLARDREIARPAQGDLIAVMSAGAYGFAMASNYNSRPRAAEIMVDGERYAVVRRRETLEDLVRGEEIPSWL